MTRLAKYSLILIVMVIFTITGVSCSSKGSALLPMYKTLTPMSASVRGTITARALSSNSDGKLSTAIAKATSQADIIYATQTAAAALDDPSRLATATAIAPVVAELPRYGVSPADGYVAWQHPPVTINLQGSQQTGYANNYQSITAGDFVLAADITWHTFNSSSGCGFTFRSDGNTNQLSQYIVNMTRVASGHMAFLGMANGKLVNFQSFFPIDKDKSFNWANDSTNRIAVVARGNLVDLYTNGEWVGQVDLTKPPSESIAYPPAPVLPPGASAAVTQDYNDQLSQLNAGIDQLNGQLVQAKQNYTSSTVVLTNGFLGFVGFSQSGNTVCTFDNAWLFVLLK